MNNSPNVAPQVFNVRLAFSEYVYSENDYVFRVNNLEEGYIVVKLSRNGFKFYTVSEVSDKIRATLHVIPLFGRQFTDEADLIFQLQDEVVDTIIGGPLVRPSSLD